MSRVAPRLSAYLRSCSSYCGSFIGPKTSSCALPRMFMPAPWITSIALIALSLLRFDARDLHHARPLRRLGGDELAELALTHVIGFGPVGREALLHVGQHE